MPENSPVLFGVRFGIFKKPHDVYIFRRGVGIKEAFDKDVIGNDGNRLFALRGIDTRYFHSLCYLELNGA